MMKMNTVKGRGTRTKLIAAISALAVVLILILNLVMTYLGLRYTLFVDMTPEGLYTLSDAMKSECDFIDELAGDEKVKITFCSDPDTLLASEITRVNYIMAIELDNRYKNLETETVNSTYNPTAVSKYLATSLSKINPTDIIISYGNRYRIINAQNFWTKGSDDVVWAYNGEYKLASIIKSVTAKERPKAYFVTDNGCSYYDASVPDRTENEELREFYYLLSERGLDVKTLSLSDCLREGKAIPEDCVLLIINNPTEDFTSAETDLDSFYEKTQTELLDRYLVSNHGSLMVMKDYDITLPVFESFLREWGFEFSTALVTDKSPSNFVADGETPTYQTIIGQYNTDEESYAYQIYGDYASLSSAPKTVFSKTGYITCSFGEGTVTPEHGTYSITRNYASLFSTSRQAEAHKDLTLVESNKALDIAAVTTRLDLDQYTAEYSYSYVFCTASGDFLSNNLLGNASYANYDVISALVENMSRTDRYASIELGGVSYNSDNVGGKELTDTALYTVSDFTTEAEMQAFKKELFNSSIAIWLTVLVMVMPILVASLGVAICIKRRFK